MNLTLLQKNLKLKLFLLFFLAIALTGISVKATNAASDLSFPRYSGYVNDFENILNNDAELEATISTFEKESSIEVAIVTVSDFQGTTIEDYAVKLFSKWGIGKKDSDNGLLIIVSKNSRQSRFEVGYGLEGTLPDALTGRIQDHYMIPYFQKDDYSEGVKQGLDATIKILNGDKSIASNLETVNTSQEEIDKFSSFMESAVIPMLIIIYIMAMTKSWWLGGVVGFIGGIIIGAMYFQPWGWLIFPIPAALLGLLLDFILSNTFIGELLFIIARSGGFSSRGGSGGGISFGGGSSGGGGSSRSW
jgi:uncharacterized protein